MAAHLSLRLPWHDRGWDGHVCDNPTANVYCTGEYGLLAHEIRQRKRDAEEEREASPDRRPFLLPGPDGGVREVRGYRGDRRALPPTDARLTVNLALIPMFLFAATFFPLSQYPTGLQWVVRCTPLYQGVALERGLTTGQLQWTMLLNVLYLVVMGAVGLRVATRRLRHLLQP